MVRATECGRPIAGKPRRTSARNLLRRRRTAPGRLRGAAYVEAVILAVFLIIIFAAVQYLGRYFDAKQNALLTARRCAWLFSKNACVNDAKHPLPAICNSVVDPSKTQEVHDEELRAAIDDRAHETAQTPDGSRNVPRTDTEGKIRTGVNDSLHPMLELLVGQSLTAVASKDIARTPISARAPGSIATSYYLPCNLAARSPWDVVGEIWTGLVDIP